MIIIKIIGGLGNQMFQYSLGRSLSLKTGQECKYDISGFSVYKLHRYSLDHFRVQITTASEHEIKKFMISPLAAQINELMRLLHIKGRLKNPRYITEKSSVYNPAIFNLSGDHYFDGYWQSEKYFLDCQDAIRQELQVITEPDGANREYLKTMSTGESVAVHFRRGDYVSNLHTNTVHGVTSLDYYHQAMATMTEKLGNPVFYVFSDDIAWVKQNINQEHRVVFVDHNKADRNYEDIRLMSSCLHQITANSSFSWWGAWLNPHPKKIVIAPKRWFQAEYDDRDIVPAGWLRI